MNYKLTTKNKDGKWWTYGNVRTTEKGSLQAGLKISSLKELIAQTEAEGKEWINFMMFEDDKKESKQTANVSEDEIPF